MNGLLNILKPTGITSSNVVVKVRKLLNIKEVGHMGTLDPMGSGVLIIGLGKSNRLFNYFNEKTKTYRTIFKFGVETDTLDSQGTITSKIDKLISKDDVLKAIESMIGKSNQLPPIYSAIKVNGYKSYDLARKGKEVELKEREIEISSFKLIRELSDNEFEFDITCSSGTYIRSICRDLAKKIGTVGYMESIIRTQSGVFNISDSVPLNELSIENVDKYIIAPDKALNLNKVYLDGKEANFLLNGVMFNKETNDKLFYVYTNNELYGIAENIDGKIKTKTVLR